MNIISQGESGVHHKIAEAMTGLSLACNGFTVILSYDILGLNKTIE